MSFCVTNQKSEKMKEKYQKLKEKYQWAIQELQSRRMICINCNSSQVNLSYCTSCGSIPICKLHFRNRARTKQCPKCGNSSLTRRWSMPVQQ